MLPQLEKAGTQSLFSASVTSARAALVEWWDWRLMGTGWEFRLLSAWKHSYVSDSFCLFRNIRTQKGAIFLQCFISVSRGRDAKCRQKHILINDFTASLLWVSFSFPSFQFLFWPRKRDVMQAGALGRMRRNLGTKKAMDCWYQTGWIGRAW